MEMYSMWLFGYWMVWLWSVCIQTQSENSLSGHRTLRSGIRVTVSPATIWPHIIVTWAVENLKTLFSLVFCLCVHIWITACKPLPLMSCTGLRYPTEACMLLFITWWSRGIFPCWPFLKGLVMFQKCILQQWHISSQIESQWKWHYSTIW